MNNLKLLFYITRNITTEKVDQFDQMIIKHLLKQYDKILLLLIVLRLLPVTIAIIVLMKI